MESADEYDKKDSAAFTDHELLYLKQYVKLTSPIAVAIDSLQGDKNTFYGDLLPTLYTVKAELEELSQLEVIGRMANVLFASLVGKRFKNEFELNEKATMAICGSISHPAYKSKWGSVEDSEKAMVIFKQQYDLMSTKVAAMPPADHQSRNEGPTKFIRLRPTSLTNEASELTRYLLSERVDLQMLNDFPIIREMFFKFNTQLPTSAVVEGMFNFAGILDNPKRCRTLPTNFENNVVIKANSALGGKKQR